MTRVACLVLLGLIGAGLLGYWHYIAGFNAARADHWRWLGEWWFTQQALPPGFTGPLIIAGLAFVILAGFMSRFSSRVGGRLLGSAYSMKTLHGSARWAGAGDVRAAGLHARTGVVVGGWKPGSLRRTCTLRHNGPEHIMAFAPTRSGKGVSLIIPTLMEWQESAFVLDIKGENYALSSGQRKKAGQRILRFDPAGADNRVRFNPLAEVRLGTGHEIQDVQNIASMIIDPDGKGLKDYWMKSGFAWLAASILHVLYRVRIRDRRVASLEDVGKTLSEHDDLGDVLQDMQAFDHGAASANAFVRETASEMLKKAPAELSGVHSSAMTELALYRDPIVARNTAESDFRIHDLMNGDAPVSLYLVVQPSDIDRLRPLVRIVMNLLLRRLTADMAFEDGAVKRTYKHRLLLLLDEFTSIGKLEIFERALAFMAGYGLKCFLIVQDLTQLQQAYGREESIMSNCHIRIAFAPNKIETARVLSDLCGKTTVLQRKRSSSGRAGEFSRSLSENLDATGRPLLTPEEAMKLPGLRTGFRGRMRPGDMLVFVAGLSPIYGRQTPWFLNRAWSRMAKIAPAAEAKDAPAVPKPKAASVKMPRYGDVLTADKENDDGQ